MLISSHLIYPPSFPSSPLPPAPSTSPGSASSYPFAQSVQLHTAALQRTAARCFFPFNLRKVEQLKRFCLRSEHCTRLLRVFWRQQFWRQQASPPLHLMRAMKSACYAAAVHYKPRHTSCAPAMNLHTSLSPHRSLSSSAALYTSPLPPHNTLSPHRIRVTRPSHAAGRRQQQHSAAVLARRHQRCPQSAAHALLRLKL